MATITFSRTPVPVVTGLTVTTGARSAALSWDPTDNMVEVWSGPFGHGAESVKIATTSANTYTVPNLAGTTFFWVRAVNAYGTESPFTGPVEATPPVLTASPTAGTAIATPLIPSVDEYSVWYPCAKIEWTAVPGDIVACTAYASTNITNVVCTGEDRAALFMRSRLVNETSGAEVWASTSTKLVYDRHGDVDYGLFRQVTSFNERFYADPGLLMPGTQYSWYVEVRKEQVAGTPTLNVVVNDVACFTDAASS